MTKIYAELNIANTSRNLYQECSKFITLINWKHKIILIGDKKRNGKISDMSVLSFVSQRFETPYIEDVSNILCDTLEPIANDLSAFIQENHCKIWIYFVISLGDEGVGITINKRLLKLATILQSPIHFDGL